ncbi:MAG: 3-isopropylmalate dehydratase small subunit [Desulfobacterales bacterium]
MKTFGGSARFLDRADINTDEIIPARYLTEVERAALKPFLLEDLRLEGFDPQRDLAGCEALIARANFGCGSSREHAAWALEVNGIRLVVAPSFARIFRQNMFNGGLLALELPAAAIDGLFRRFARRPGIRAVADLEAGLLEVGGEGEVERVPFELGGFERALLEAGGWLEYADRRYEAGKRKGG